ncbi:hypothetical protein [Nocardioides rubriscoriae]|uniref:hypothetical protein n=1 Tax=Nocardioides rubriscoriae TaxID=642762 RepID=UPI0011E04883|nr:hypothetical protein [Nocardioides rubriscoriae]
MNQWVTGAVIVLSLVAGGSLAVLMIRDVAAQDRTFGFLAVIELVLVAQLVGGCIALGRTDRDVEGVLFVSYLVGIVLALPIGVFWSLAERTRAGTAVLLVAVLTVVALQLRLETIWGGVGA